MFSVVIGVCFAGSCLSVDYDPATGSLDTGCARGVLSDSLFIGLVSCECHRCTRHWTNVTGCHKPRRHILACRFGGPRYGVNCWNNNVTVERWWTARENELAAGIALHGPAFAVMDAEHLTYSFGFSFASSNASLV